MRPTVVKLAESMRSQLSQEDQKHLTTALDIYRDWNGDMTEESVAASVHMHYMLAFHKSLFHKQVPGEDMEEERMLISDNYPFIQAYQRLLLEVE